MQEILDRFGFATLLNQERPFIAEDFVFLASRFPSASELRSVHEEVMLDETPLAVVRLIHLEHGSRPHTSARLRLALCWHGFRDALTLLARFSQAFQRAIPLESVVNAANQYGAGDFGIAWAWSGRDGPDIGAFVKNNVFVTIEGHDAADVVAPMARELAAAIGRLRSGGEYVDAAMEQFTDLRRRVGDVPRVASGDRLDLGVLPRNGSTIFFLTTEGSVNRSPEREDTWYYRAGALRGRQTITIFRVGNGILPLRDRLSVEVI